MESAVNRFKIAEGDWVCSDVHCGNINFARRNKCNRCGKDRAEGPVTVKKKLGQEIGKVLADKSRGLFSADDWQCIKCGNVNWARRQQCNMCNAPKFGEVEERTGYGGGYNDRGVVEYIQRDDSDSEYDEFGRRKKKKSHKDSSSDVRDSSDSEERSEKRKPGADPEEEEDEDEDEGSEDDLSKYDLSEWGAPGDDSGKQEEEREMRSRSEHQENRDLNRNRRSRSRGLYRGNLIPPNLRTFLNHSVTLEFLLSIIEVNDKASSRGLYRGNLIPPNLRTFLNHSVTLEFLLSLK